MLGARPHDRYLATLQRSGVLLYQPGGGYCLEDLWFQAMNYKLDNVTIKLRSCRTDRCTNQSHFKAVKQESAWSLVPMNWDTHTHSKPELEFNVNDFQHWMTSLISILS